MTLAEKFPLRLSIEMSRYELGCEEPDFHLGDTPAAVVLKVAESQRKYGASNYWSTGYDQNTGDHGLLTVYLNSRQNASSEILFYLSALALSIKGVKFEDLSELADGLPIVAMGEEVGIAFWGLEGHTELEDRWHPLGNQAFGDLEFRNVLSGKGPVRGQRVYSWGDDLHHWLLADGHKIPCNAKQISAPGWQTRLFKH